MTTLEDQDTTLFTIPKQITNILLTIFCRFISITDGRVARVATFVGPCCRVVRRHTFGSRLKPSKPSRLIPGPVCEPQSVT